MRLMRRRLLVASTLMVGASVAVPTIVLRPRGAQSSSASPYENPFQRGSRRHETYRALRHSAPKVEGRLSRWIEMAMRERETLRTSGHPVVARWRQELAALPKEHNEAMVVAINQMVNRDVRYLSDWEHGQVRDRWYGPVATLEEGGDCEDYALLKGFLLHTRGWPVQSLHLVAGIMQSGEGHMMLGVDYADGRQVLLDNRTMNIHRRPYRGWIPKYQIGPEQDTLIFFKPRK